MYDLLICLFPENYCLGKITIRSCSCVFSRISPEFAQQDARITLDSELEFREDHRSNLTIPGKHEKERAEDVVAIAIFVKMVLFVMSLRRYPQSKERRMRYVVLIHVGGVRSHGSE